MEISFTERALDELDYWKKSGNKKVVARIKLLLQETGKNPFDGIGKPEALKHNYKGCWSRRITGEHRLVYKVEKDTVIVMQLRFHY